MEVLQLQTDLYVQIHAVEHRIKRKRLVQRKLIDKPLNYFYEKEYLTISDAKTMEAIESSLIRILMEGPAVSLKGSPTVSPTTAAL